MLLPAHAMRAIRPKKIAANSQACFDYKNDFLEWLCDLEFVKMDLPRPDLVIFLDMPPQVSDKLLQKRGTSSGSKDIHERDREYLHHCYAVYKDMTEKYGWETVECVRNGQVRSVEDIHNDVYALVKKVIVFYKKSY